MRLDQQRLRDTLLITALTRINIDGEQRGLVGLAERHALLDPGGDRFVKLRVGLEALAALVLNSQSRLFQDQALLGTGRKNAPAAIRLDDLLVVGFWIVGEDRQLETVLPVGLRMTTASVAPRLA